MDPSPTIGSPSPGSCPGDEPLKYLVLKVRITFRIRRAKGKYRLSTEEATKTNMISTRIEVLI